MELPEFLLPRHGLGEVPRVRARLWQSALQMRCEFLQHQPGAVSSVAVAEVKENWIGKLSQLYSKQAEPSVTRQCCPPKSGPLKMVGWLGCLPNSIETSQKRGPYLVSQLS